MALPLALCTLSARDTAPGTSMAPQDYASQYRTQLNIVWSCLTTIFMCTWVSLHPNIPQPLDTRGLGRWKKLKIHVLRLIKGSLIPFIVAILVPEWVLGVSLSQFLMARSLAKKHGM